MYTAKLVTLKDIFTIPGKDRIVAATMNELGDTKVIISKEYPLTDTYIYFPPDVRLSMEFCEANDLIIRKDSSGKKIGGGYFDDNCRVRAQKFGGVRSEGIVVPLTFLEYLRPQHERVLNNILLESPGYTFDRLGSTKVCEKYTVRRANHRPSKFDVYMDKLDNSRFYRIVPYIRKVRYELLAAKRNIKDFRDSFDPYSYNKFFPRHDDTDALKHHLSQLPINTEVTITEKVHGTSAQTGKVLDPSVKGTLLRYMFGKDVYRFQVSTRNVVLKTGQVCDYYKDAFRWECAKKFENILDGEQFSYEIVGFTNNGRPIMEPQPLSKIKRDVNIKDYSDPMIYTYGCEEGQCDIYVYKYSKMVDGKMQIQTWDETVRRCKELELKTVPELDRFIYDGNVDTLLKRLDKFMANDTLLPSSIDKRHITEGVVLRFNNEPWNVLKHKSWMFGVLEGFNKDLGIEDVN